MAKAKSFQAKLAKGKSVSKRFNRAGEEIITVKVLKPTEVLGKPGVFRYREVFMDVTPSNEKEIFG
ncbi:MAG: hypothetical protein V2A56_00640 [bacterium]